MSRPEIAIQKKIVMEDHMHYIKRTQRDYTMSFELSVVKEVESGQLSVTAAQRKYGLQGGSTVLNWLRKYGNFEWKIKRYQTCQKVLNKELWSWKLK